MLEYNKNYVILALNYILKNSKRTLSASEIDKGYRNNNILKEFFGKSSE